MLVLTVVRCVLWTSQQDRGHCLIAPAGDRKGNGRVPGFSSEEGMVAFWEKHTSSSGNGTSYSLPLAWHEINCCAPLNIQGKTPATLPPPALVTPSPSTWLDPGSLRVTHIALDFVLSCCTKTPTFPSYREHCQRYVGSGSDEMRGYA